MTSYMLASCKSVSNSLPKPRSANERAVVRVATASACLRQCFWQLPRCKYEVNRAKRLSGDFSCLSSIDFRKYRQAVSYMEDCAQSMAKLLSRLEQSISGQPAYILRAYEQYFRLRRDWLRCAQQLPKLLNFCPRCLASSPSNGLPKYFTAVQQSLSLQQQFPMWKLMSWYNLTIGAPSLRLSRNSVSSSISTLSAPSKSA